MLGILNSLDDLCLHLIADFIPTAYHTHLDVAIYSSRWPGLVRMFGTTQSEYDALKKKYPNKDSIEALTIWLGFDEDYPQCSCYAVKAVHTSDDACPPDIDAEMSRRLYEGNVQALTSVDVNHLMSRPREIPTRYPLTFEVIRNGSIKRMTYSDNRLRLALYCVAMRRDIRIEDEINKYFSEEISTAEGITYAKACLQEILDGARLPTPLRDVVRKRMDIFTEVYAEYSALTYFTAMNCFNEW